MGAATSIVMLVFSAIIVIPILWDAWKVGERMKDKHFVIVSGIIVSI